MGGWFTKRKILMQEVGNDRRKDEQNSLSHDRMPMQNFDRSGKQENADD
jgi:hypothetical protein